jgi:hypothetical protein
MSTSNFNAMNDLESKIQESYDRLHVDNTIYLLKNHRTDYGQLPDPDEVTQVYKADVRQIDPEYTYGIHLLDWFNFSTPDEEQLGPIYQVSPREVFLLRELKSVINDRTNIPQPRASRLESMLESTKTDRFKGIVASEMARVVLERFAEDPRDDSGLLDKR